MNNYRWFNQSLPQTLQMAVILLYINAFFFFIYRAFAAPIGLVLMVGYVAGAFGIANEKKWGYWVGLGAALLKVLFILINVSIGDIFRSLDVMIELAFDIALVALLAHPMSRSYQRIWFR